MMFYLENIYDTTESRQTTGDVMPGDYIPMANWIRYLGLGCFSK